MAEGWTPTSWEVYPKVQMAEWEDKDAAAKVMTKLSSLPPLVQAKEADDLKSLIAAAGRGEGFIVQGGDCAERFIDCSGDRLETQLKLMLHMSMVMEHVTGKRTQCVCRIAGQYGKPRSKPTEVVEGYGEIMSFKGDNINGFAPADRKWDPERLVQGYFHSAATLNFLRSFTAAVEPIELAAIKIDELKKSLDFDSLKLKAGEISARYASEPHTRFFTAHEAMQLDLETALTRKVGDRFYNLSAHFVWIGDRTRQIPGAHVEYFKGISNPVGCKVGPTMSTYELKELVKQLNPNNEEGRLTIITRYGASKVRDMLPKHIKAVQETGVPVTWQCDAVHGNGIVAVTNKYKTRKVDDILQEILECIAVHKECGSVLGGIHLECTGQTTVTEILGGCVGITEDMLPQNYETYCDPRLNYAQAIETVFKVANQLK
jgi:3-deoxy-7-phosphoheptulonate synthase